MTKQVQCAICEKTFSSKGIFTHYERAHGSDEQKAKYSSGNNGKYDVLAERAKQEKDRKIEEYLQQPKHCEECNSILNYDNRSYKCCSSKCAAIITNRVRKANGWTPSEDHRRRTSEKLSGKVYVEPIEIEADCEFCKNKFIQVKHYTKRLKRFCSKSCGANHYSAKRKANLPEKRAYKLSCKFNFALKDYPGEFDFSLVESFGWYAAANRGNNLTGVSRDHMVSVDFGWKNKIDPKIISHPANCCLLRHTDNKVKGTKCSITIDELYQKIEQWNVTYNGIVV